MPMTPIQISASVTKIKPIIYTASRSSTGITGLLGLLVSSFAEIIGSRVNDNSSLHQVRMYLNISCRPTYANNALGTDQLDELVGGRALTVALSIGLEVTQITYMTSLIGRSTVSLAVGVDYAIPISPTLSNYVCVDHSQWGPADVQPLVLSPN